MKVKKRFLYMEDKGYPPKNLIKTNVRKLSILILRFLMEITKRITIAILVLIAGDNFLFSIYEPHKKVPVTSKKEDKTIYVKGSMKIV